jgi:hypothetical protein
MGGMMRGATRWRAALVAFLVLYVLSYVVVSRRAFAESRRMNTEGFYFFPPEPTDRWRLSNTALVLLYCPLIYIDVLLGTGLVPADEPLWPIA